MSVENSATVARPGVYDSRTPGWLPAVMARLREVGYAIITGVLPGALIEETRVAMYRTREHIWREVGKERLDQAGELGVLRCMPKFEALFLRYLEIPAALAIVDAAVGPSAILHTQNGFILPSLPPLPRRTIFQNSFHRYFPRHPGGYVASVNVMFALDEFTAENGGTISVPGMHH